MSRMRWWIDYLENEMEPAMRADLDKLLAKSGKDQASLEALASLRQWVADSDPVEELWREKKMASLRLKIDQAIDRLPKIKSRSRKPSTPKKALTTSPDF